jgi:hypothetical protein
MLDDLLGHELRQAFRRAKDEWTAKMQNNSAQKRAENFEHTFRAEGPYDFFSKFRNRVENASENQYQNDAIFKEKMGLGLKEIEKTYQEQAKKSAEAFVELVNSGFSQEEAVAFLQDKDFEDWPKTVRRLKAFQAKNRA